MPFIQLPCHSITSLPQHPDLKACSPGLSIQEQIRATLEEAHEILASLPSELKTDSKLRKSPPSDAKVKLSQGWRTPLHGEPHSRKEYWVSRESEHVDSNCGNGSATWQEFQHGLHHDHAIHEMEYTPSVTRVVTLLEWVGGKDGNLGQAFGIKNTRYSHFEAQFNLIVHTFKPDGLIQPRAFLSFTVSATTDNLVARNPNDLNTRQATKGFVTVQVPYKMDQPEPTSDSTDDQYNSLYAKIMNHVPRGVIFGHYASVERVELLVLPQNSAGSLVSISASAGGNVIGNDQMVPNTSSTSTSNAISTDRRIKWTMATTSDAGGKIPGWVQRSWILGGAPKAVVADVGLFVGWVADRRRPKVTRREEGERERVHEENML